MTEESASVTRLWVKMFENVQKGKEEIETRKKKKGNRKGRKRKKRAVEEIYVDYYKQNSSFHSATGPCLMVVTYFFSPKLMVM